MSTKPPGQKRKHKSLTLRTKAEIISRLDKRETVIDLAKYYGVGRATIYDVKRNRVRIEEFIKTTDFNLSDRRTLKHGDFPRMEKALVQWIIQERKRNVLISAELIQEKAKQLYKEIMNKSDFKASNGWLDKFKKRYSIRFSNTTMAKTPRKNTNTTSPLAKRLQDKINELSLSPEQVYSAEISGLFWKSLPEKILGNFTFKDRITIMPCSNASGTHKLDLLVIGSEQNPRNNNSHLSINYLTQNQARVTQEIFLKWFNEHFVPSATEFLIKQQLPHRALLILHSNLGFPTEDVIHSKEGFFQVIVIPKEHDLVLTVKNHYRKNLLFSIINQKHTVTKYLKEIKLTSIILNLIYAWHCVSPNLIIAFWKELWPSHPLIFAVKNVRSIETDALNWDLQQAVAQLCDKLSCDIPSLDEIDDWLCEDSETKLDIIVKDEQGAVKVQCCDSDGEDGRIETSGNVVGYDEALAAVNTSLEWAEQNCVDIEDILTLKRLQEKMLKDSFSAKEAMGIEELYLEEYVNEDFVDE